MQSKLADSVANFEIIKIEPSLVLMRHKDNRKIFRYVESVDLNCPVLPDCPDIILPLRVQTGYLYETCFMTLSSQIQNINRSGQKCMFEQHELVNTVEPIIKILKVLHGEGQSHGALSPDSIVIDEMGNLKLYYPGIKESAKLYYSDSGIKEEDDFRALGIILLDLLGFGKSSQEEEIRILKHLSKCQKYSEGFILCLLCMLKRKGKFMDLAIAQLLKIETQGLPEEVKQYYENELAEKPKRIQQIKRAIQKVQFTPPLIKHADQTPKKTIQTTKKCIKVQDSENRKYLEEAKKKKPSEHVLKRVSNGKTEGDCNGNVISPNYKKILRDIRETKQREDLFKMAVTIKRMRTVSKKKVG